MDKRPAHNDVVGITVYILTQWLINNNITKMITQLLYKIHNIVTSVTSNDV